MSTKLRVYNATQRPEVVWVTLGATEGCCHDVSHLTGVHVEKVNPLQGYFNLHANGWADIIAPEGEGLNGNLCFGSPPINCPTADFPHGVNLAEFIINNGFQPGGQETIDISCVCGANTRISMDVSSYDWTTNGGAIPVRVISNEAWDKNTGLLGVFPYGCDNCTASVAPPECIGQQPQFAQSAPICNVQRPAADNQGGTVTVVLLDRL